MESSGKAGMIHVSSSCAEKLKEAGFAEWLILREDTPDIKGKGTMTTYWLHTRENESHGTSSVSAEERIPEVTPTGVLSLQSSLHERRVQKALTAKVERLVEWNVQLLASILQSVVARRLSDRTKVNVQQPVKRKLAEHKVSMLAEVEEVLALPQFDAKVNRNQVNPASIELPSKVLSQLSTFISRIAATYLDNPFHNVSLFSGS
jgi:hypothetical protein